ncbi:protein FAM76B-like [Saccoglossus kowalevskii]|uniref:Protein FAM76B-like n=1 Tax=Saccoglossus kowalevskii TaxID=10224 RepID=A0ABM0LUQ8_SACKO|nr:PREDICTED: protein FAM76B-like [Saccoglossus kowalevskii]
MSSQPLFACTKCNSRHPFEELSQGQQLCKECRGAYPVVKCTYCRAEFQQENKSSTNSICKKCSEFVKKYGTPKSCEYCNIIAAFIGNKCQRCTNSEKKYGPPLTCEQCKQGCAFDRTEDRKKVNGKLLCWLCTLSYKRVLQKAKKQNHSTSGSSGSHRHSSSHGSSQHSHHHHHHHHHHKNSTSTHHKSKSHDKHKSHREHHHHHQNKRMKTEHSSNGVIPSNLNSATSVSSDITFMDAGNTDHMVAMTQLREQVASLKKQLNEKDKVILEKDKKITDLKAQLWETEKLLKNKITTVQKTHLDAIEVLQTKNRNLTKQLSQVSKKESKSS